MAFLDERMSDTLLRHQTGFRYRVYLGSTISLISTVAEIWKNIGGAHAASTLISVFTGRCWTDLIRTCPFLITFWQGSRFWWFLFCFLNYMVSFLSQRKKYSRFFVLKWLKTLTKTDGLDALDMEIGLEIRKY